MVRGRERDKDRERKRARERSQCLLGALVTASVWGGRQGEAEEERSNRHYSTRQLCFVFVFFVSQAVCV